MGYLFDKEEFDAVEFPDYVDYVIVEGVKEVTERDDDFKLVITGNLKTSLGELVPFELDVFAPKGDYRAWRDRVDMLLAVGDVVFGELRVDYNGEEFANRMETNQTPT